MSSNKLDSILEYGGRFYKSIGIDRFLSVEDLPDTVPIHDINVKVKFNFNIHGIIELKETLRDALKETILSNITNSGELMKG